MKRSRSSVVTSKSLVAFALVLLASPAQLPLASRGAQTQDRSRLLTQPEVKILPSKEKRWALIVGIDEYKNDVTSLKGAVNDARALKDVLVKYAGFPASQVVLLTTDATDPDQLPTRANILDELDSFTHKIPTDGLLLFSFSGHGVSIDNDAYLVPSDGRITKNPRLLRDFSIDVQRIKEAIKDIKVDQVVMLLDACRNQPGKGDVANELAEAYKRGFSFDVANSEVKAFATLYATSIGSRAFEFYDRDTHRYRGYFSYAIEEGMKGKAANASGEITLSGLITFIENTVPKRVRFDKGENQLPSKEIVGYKDSELVLAIGGNASAPTGTTTGSSQPMSFKNQYGIEMMYVGPGTFMMGSAAAESNEKPVHQVTISQQFYMGKYEVTQEQWMMVMGHNPSSFQDCGRNCPVENISWNEAQDFINKLNEAKGGYRYRLPSEAEWEYASRAGTTGDDNEDLDDRAWYAINSVNKTHFVGTKQPNAFGLYDMAGNVFEWCADSYHPNYEGAPSDGSAWLNGGEAKDRVLRGGSWFNFGLFLRSANRSWDAPDVRNFDIGLRVAALARSQ